LLTDLKSLHAEGVDLGPQYGIRKGTVVQVLGDNLGSHMLGVLLRIFLVHIFVASAWQHVIP